MSALPTIADSAEQAYIDQAIAHNNGRPGALLGILEAVQEHHPYKYLSAEALRYVAGKLDIPLSRILLESLRLELGLGLNDEEESGDADKLALTTKDGKFTLRTVACFGQCALAPVVEVNHRICGHANERTLQREVRALERESE